jgi:hypothetical protein
MAKAEKSPFGIALGGVSNGTVYSKDVNQYDGLQLRVLF